MITFVIVGALLPVFAAAAYRREKTWQARLADEQRRTADTRSEMQKQIDASASATFLRLRDALVNDARWTDAAVNEALQTRFEHAKDLESQGVQENLGWFRERVGMLNAARAHAQSRVSEASSLVTTVSAENTLLRTLLEKALSLPLDTPESHRVLFLSRCSAVLEAPRATLDCPSEDFWKAYVIRHKTLHGSPVITPDQPAAAQGDA